MRLRLTSGGFVAQIYVRVRNSGIRLAFLPLFSRGSSMRLKNVLIALFCLAVCTVCVLADTLRLKDGSVLEGKVIEQPDRYWIKLADGTTKTVLKKDVLSLERGDTKPKVPGA